MNFEFSDREARGSVGDGARLGGLWAHWTFRLMRCPFFLWFHAPLPRLLMGATRTLDGQSMEIHGSEKHFCWILSIPSRRRRERYKPVAPLRCDT